MQRHDKRKSLIKIVRRADGKKYITNDYQCEQT